jgi:glycerophosphoryl diester phosphodiesterase
MALTPILIGHRGAAGLAPENTAASIKAAQHHGVDGIEIDLRVTQDHIVVIHHDNTIHTQAATCRIADASYRELKKLEPSLLTLSEALALIQKNHIALLDIKPGIPLAPVYAALNVYAKQGGSMDDLWLGSFSQSILIQLRAHYPQATLAVIESWSGIRASFRAREVKTNVLIMKSTWLWSGFIRSVQRSGYKLYAYGLLNKARGDRWQKAGLAGIITDRPDHWNA